ncbi:hypothetical protein [Flavobacterium johnsoniae]|uniref:Uncharacterized protein n=1 Tax=Flavobacterium johnsoniae TaxID=986 RepID=A0A1M5IJV6_FLAJO|nr:hypothetical protein [Flavobacterium johnsoniae]SHG28535.1 hypothetical protein SAMN05444388_102133 [Flavobacterium johnsoniae]
MPNEVEEKLKQRELKTLKRFDAAKTQSVLLRSFFEKGFKSYDAFYAIVKNYYPDLSDKRLWDFWHFRILDDEISNKLTIVFEKLKSE